MEEGTENIPININPQVLEKNTITKKIRENPWILSTFIFGIVMIVLLVGTFGGGITGKTVSKEKAAENLIKYLNTVAASEVTLVDIKDNGDLYLATIKYQDNDLPVYVTKDGSYYTMNLLPLSSETSSSQPEQKAQDIPKTDKPSVELYVFTYCPYGLQMEKAMIPVVNLLKDKIDFKIRQIGAMHGEHEKLEAERQLCIEKEYPTKFLDYVSAFAEDTSIGSCNGDATCLTPKLNALFIKLGIDASKINSCMTTDGESLYNAEVTNAQSKNIGGSPTLVINGVQSQASRSPEAIKGVICNAFNNVPSECTQTLSTSQAAAGFGNGTSSSSSAAASC
ncbi:MAG: thioredoxin domain-containing protein [Candidatus Pacearchaeota archaeon]|nr:thioredoxin domain-containing protein [Candidatus Pacearchaeota archaeon]